MSDVKIVISAENANSEAIINAVSTAVEKLGAEIKTTADIARREKDASKVFSSGWVSLGRDLSELTNNTFELLKKGIYGIKTAYNSLKEGADFSEAQQNFRAYAASIGKDADDLMQKMRQASKNQVSDMELMESATKALRLGVAKDAGTIGKLLEIADAKGDLFGKGLKETFDNIVGAISKGQGRTLIELGVLPESFGRASNAADLLKNKVLLLKAVLQQGQTDIKALASVGDTSSDDFNRLDAAISNTTTNLKILLSDAAKPLVSQLLEGTVPAVNSAVDSLREWTKANLENKDKLQDHIETLGSVKTAVEYAIAAYAGWKMGAMIESVVLMTGALLKMEKAQILANAAVLKSPYVMAGMAIAGSAWNLYGKYSDYKDAAAADDYASRMDKELEDQNNPASIARAEIMKLEAELKTYGDISQLTAKRDALLQKINSHKQTIKNPLAAGIMSGYGLAGQTNDLGKAEDELKKIEAEAAKIEAVNKRLADARDTLKTILEQRKAILDAKKTPATGKKGKTGDNSNGENEFDGIVTGAEEAEKAMRKLREETLKAQKNLFDTLLSNFKKELASISDLEDPLVKYFEAAELAEKTTLSLAAAVGTVTGGGATSLYQALSGVKDAAFNAEESMFDLFQRSKREAEDAAKSVKEFKAAYESVQKSSVMLWNNTTGMEFSVAAANWFSGGLFTAQNGDKTKDAVKDLKEPLSKTIAEAVQAGFANADFSNLELTLGSIISNVISKSVSQSNPIMSASGAINWGNLGINLATSAVTSVLTRSGRFFGGREEHGKEAIQQAADLKGRMGQAYVDSFVSEITSVFATRAMKDAIANARLGYSGTQTGYTWNDSGNGIWSDRTRTYAMIDNGASAALKKLTDAVKEAETFSENQESWINLQAAKGYEYSALQAKVDAYKESLGSVYFGQHDLRWSDGSVNEGQNLTVITREVEATLAEMVRELGAATAERFTAAASGFSKYAPWLQNFAMAPAQLTQNGAGGTAAMYDSFDYYLNPASGMSRDQQYDAFEKLQNDYADRNINGGLLQMIKESGSGRYELEKLRVTGSEDYAEAYADYLDKQISAIEEVMERQEEIFNDATRTFEERSAALANYEAAQDSYYQAKLDSIAAEQAAEEAIKQKELEAAARSRDRMASALNLYGEIAQAGTKIYVLTGGKRDIAYDELIRQNSDDPAVVSALKGAEVRNDGMALWGEK